MTFKRHSRYEKEWKSESGVGVGVESFGKVGIGVGHLASDSTTLVTGT